MKKLSFIFVLFSLVVSSCERSGEVRQYTEIAMDEAAAPEISVLAPDPHVKDPHSGFTTEQLQTMLQEQGLSTTSTEKKEGLTWTTPSGWEEKPASGMRLASFINKEKPGAIDCSIVTLGAGAGGLEANITRWLGQIKVEVPSEEKLAKFLQDQEKLKTSSGIEATMLNFTQLQNDQPDATSMIAAILDLPEQRIFVKMTGSRQDVLKNLKPFKALVQSVK